MASNSTLLDGQFTRGLFVNRARTKYPFLGNNDVTARIVERDWRVRTGTFQPGQVGIDRNPDAPELYLMAETEPMPTGISDVLGLVKTFANVPADVVTYGSRVITKPNPPGTSKELQDWVSGVTTSVNRTGVFSNDSFFANDNRVFTAEAGFSVTPGCATGGTFTLTYKTSTTAALAYNASDATVTAAVNGLVDVILDGLTTFCINDFEQASTGQLQIVITSGSTVSPFTGNGAGLSPAAATTIYALNYSTTLQALFVSRQVTMTAHGLTGTENLFIGGNISYLIPGSQPTDWWKVIDANTISYSAGAQASSLFGVYLRDYTPGTDRVGIRLTQKFYLPGVTPGIPTAASIPLPALLVNDAELLAAVIVTPTGYLTYDASELTRWNDWPIYTQTFQEINMANL